MRLGWLKSPGFVAISIFGLSVLGLLAAQRYYGGIYRGWDAQFYYALANSVVHDHDLDITNNLKLTPYAKPFDPDHSGSWSAAPWQPGTSPGDPPRIVSKYPIGMSIVEVPWIALGRQLAGSQTPANPGYSDVELWTVALGLGLIFTLGMMLLYRFLCDTFDRSAAIIGILSCWMGTSLFYYSAIFPFMAHAVSFAALVAMMILSRKLMNSTHVNRTIIGIGLCVGMVFLIRPQQAIIGFLIVPQGIYAIRRLEFRKWLPGAIIGVILALACVGLQLGFNHSQFGRYTLSGYSIGGEGFRWLEPQIAFVLFSTSRGLIYYSPIVILAAISLILYAKSIPSFLIPTILNGIIQIYLIAAWSSPEQGDSFGTRMWSDNAAIVAVGISSAWHKNPRFYVRCALVGLVGSATLWTMIRLLKYM